MANYYYGPGGGSGGGGGGGNWTPQGATAVTVGCISHRTYSLNSLDLMSSYP